MTTATNSMINGVDTQALSDLVKQVTREPRTGLAKFHVTTKWQGAARSVARVDSWTFGGEKKPRGYTIHADEPGELLGDASAPNPQELLMAGLNACMMVGYVAGCAMKGVELESIEIETEGELDLRGFLAIDPGVKPGYDELRYTVRIKGDGTPEQYQEVHELVMRTSPNYFNLASPVRLRPRLVVG